MVKNKILDKNRNFGQKIKLCQKSKILDKNRNFGEKIKLCQKSKILSKIRNFPEKLAILRFFTKNRAAYGFFNSATSTLI